VAAAVGAHNLGALHAEGAVAAAQHGARHGVEEGRPAAAAAELVRGAVQRGVAARARVGALRREVLVEGARVRGLGALLAEDAELLWAVVSPGWAMVAGRAYRATGRPSIRLRSFSQGTTWCWSCWAMC
jgi:hypothetical protein